MPVNPPRRLADDEPLSAAWLNDLVAFIAANQIRVAPDSGLTGSVGANGVTLGLQETPDLWIKLTFAASATGAVGSYSWIEQVPATGGTWTNGFRKGYAATDGSRGGVPADPAWESSLNGSLATNYIVRASRDPAVGRLSFRAGVCPASSSSGGSGTGTTSEGAG